jgi:protein-disulfide isomerase
MISKQAKKRPNRKAARSAESPLGLKQYSLIIGVVVVAVIVVAAFVILGQGSGATSAQPGEVSQDKSIGSPNAPVVVVEYADFQCPYCKQFAVGPEQQLRKEYVDSGKVRFAFRHMAFIGTESVWAAEATECANEQERFWDYQDRLYQEQGAENSGTFSQENLKRFAADLKLDTQKFNECLDTNKYQAKIDQDMAEAQRLGVSSTPTLFVNGQLIRNGSDYPVLQAAVEAALKKQAG